MTVADVIVRALPRAGVRMLFGVPGGGTSLDVIEAARTIDMRFVLTATENAAAIAAIAYARTTGAPGACLAGLGPGVASIVNGVACARLDRVPLIVITDAHPAAADGCTHQRLDHRALLGSIAKRSWAVSADNAKTIVDDAVRCAMSAPAGPVHLDCASDVAAADITREAAGRSFATTAAEDDVAPAAQASTLTVDDGALAAARRPLLIAGVGAVAHSAAIRRLVRAQRVPAMVTYMAKGVVPDRDAWFAGVFTNGALEQDILADADLVLAVGLDEVELLPRPWRPRQRVVHIGGDVAAGLDRVSRSLPRSEWDFDGLQRTVAMQRFRVEARGDALAPDRVVRRAARALPGARVTVDAGAHMFPATLLWPVDEPGGMLISNGLSTMGFAVPAAIGAALADRDRMTVALTGDGGLLMCVGELATLARERLRVVVIVFHDGSLSLIDVKQRQRRLDRRGVELGAIDWAVVARGFGIEAHAATTPDEFDRALAAAAQATGPLLIDAAVDPASYADLLSQVRG